MILVTVGTQLPFERLVRTVDAWAGEVGRSDVFAQIGPQAEPPRHVEWARDLAPAEFDERLEAAPLVVAHAGMGTILKALSLGKPVLVMPRSSALGEHRNEHQLATTQRFEAMGVIESAYDEAALARKLRELDALTAARRIRGHASEELLTTLRDFLDGRR